MSVGKISIHRFSGTEEFELKSADLLTFDVEEDEFEPNLSLEFEAKGPPVKTTDPSDAVIGRSGVSGEFNMFLPGLALDLLIGKQVPIEVGERDGEWIARIYCFEHQAARNCLLRFLSRNENQFEIQIEGEFDDPIFPNDGKPAAKFEIEANFTISE